MEPVALMRLTQINDPDELLKDYSENDIIVEKKYDGWRFQIIKEDGTPHIYIRRGDNKTENFPKIIKALDGMKNGSHIEGELVYWENGKQDVSKVQSLAGSDAEKSLEKQKDIFGEIKLHLYDIIKYDGKDVSQKPFSERTKLLQSAIKTNSIVQITKQYPFSKWQDVINEAIKEGGEGIILKIKDKPYKYKSLGENEPKPADTMFKYKGSGGKEESDDYVVYDIETTDKGNLKALFGQYYKGKLYHISDISNFSAENEEEIKNRLQKGNFVIEIGFQERLPKGLRHQKFIRFREDKSPKDATMNEFHAKHLDNFKTVKAMLLIKKNAGIEEVIKIIQDERSDDLSQNDVKSFVLKNTSLIDIEKAYAIVSSLESQNTYSVGDVGTSYGPTQIQLSEFAERLSKDPEISKLTGISPEEFKIIGKAHKDAVNLLRKENLLKPIDVSGLDIDTYIKNNPRMLSKRNGMIKYIRSGQPTILVKKISNGYAGYTFDYDLLGKYLKLDTSTYQQLDNILSKYITNKVNMSAVAKLIVFQQYPELFRKFVNIFDNISAVRKNKALNVSIHNIAARGFQDRANALTKLVSDSGYDTSVPNAYNIYQLFIITNTGGFGPIRDFLLKKKPFSSGYLVCLRRGNPAITKYTGINSTIPSNGGLDGFSKQKIAMAQGKTLVFPQNYVSSIKRGERTFTIRLEDYGIEPGDTVQAVTESGAHFCNLVIEDIKKMTPYKISKDISEPLGLDLENKFKFAPETENFYVIKFYNPQLKFASDDFSKEFDIYEPTRKIQQMSDKMIWATIKVQENVVRKMKDNPEYRRTLILDLKDYFGEEYNQSDLDNQLRIYIEEYVYDNWEDIKTKLNIVETSRIDLIKKLAGQVYEEKSGTYDIDKLIKITEDNDVIEEPIKKFKKNLKEEMWVDSNDNNISLQDVLDNKSKYKKESKGIKDVKLRYPILVWKGDVVDGNHRLAKAFDQEEDTILVKYVTDEQMKECLKNEEIDFPKTEHKDLKKRLKDDGKIYTTRTSDEQDKYEKGEELGSPFGDLKVKNIKTYKKLEDHPFFDELTDTQKEEIDDEKYDIIELEKKTSGKSLINKTSRFDLIDKLATSLETQKENIIEQRKLLNGKKIGFQLQFIQLLEGFRKELYNNYSTPAASPSKFIKDINNAAGDEFLLSNKVKLEDVLYDPFGAFGRFYSKDVGFQLGVGSEENMEQNYGVFLKRNTIVLFLSPSDTAYRKWTDERYVEELVEQFYYTLEHEITHSGQEISYDNPMLKKKIEDEEEYSGAIYWSKPSEIEARYASIDMAIRRLGPSKEFMDLIGEGISAEKKWRNKKQYQDFINNVKKRIEHYAYNIVLESINEGHNSPELVYNALQGKLTLKAINNYFSWLKKRGRILSDASRFDEINKFASEKNNDEKWSEILIDADGIKLTRKQIKDHYAKDDIRKRIMSVIKNNPVIVYIGTSKNENILKRNHNDKPIVITNDDKKNVDEPNCYWYWVERRLLSFHFVLGTKTKLGFVDLDPHGNFEMSRMKEFANKVSSEIRREYGVTASTYQSGGDGLHIQFDLPKEVDVDKLREELKKILNKLCEDYDDITTGIVKGNKLRADISTLHQKGGLRVDGSLGEKTGKEKKKLDKSQDAKDNNLNLKNVYIKVSKEELYKKVPFNIENIIKVWDSIDKKEKYNYYSVEGPFDQKHPEKSPDNYFIYKGNIEEVKDNSELKAIKYEHILDDNTGKRQADLYWDLIKNNKIDRIIEKEGDDKKKWIAYYVLVKNDKTSSRSINSNRLNEIEKLAGGTVYIEGYAGLLLFFAKQILSLMITVIKNYFDANPKSVIGFGVGAVAGIIGLLPRIASELNRSIQGLGGYVDGAIEALYQLDALIAKDLGKEKDNEEFQHIMKQRNRLYRLLMKASENRNKNIGTSIDVLFQIQKHNYDFISYDGQNKDAVGIMNKFSANVRNIKEMLKRIEESNKKAEDVLKKIKDANGKQASRFDLINKLASSSIEQNVSNIRDIRINRFLKRAKDFILYHYGPKDIDLQEDGIKSPKELVKTEFKDEVIDKYKGRAKSNSTDSILEYLEEHRGKGGSRAISALITPIPDGKLEDYTEQHNLYKIDYYKALDDKVIEKVMIVEETPGSIRTIEPKDIEDEIEKLDDIDWTKEKKLIFSEKPHFFLVLKDGILPGKYIIKDQNIDDTYRTQFDGGLYGRDFLDTETGYYSDPPNGDYGAITNPSPMTISVANDLLERIWVYGELCSFANDQDGYEETPIPLRPQKIEFIPTTQKVKTFSTYEPDETDEFNDAEEIPEEINEEAQEKTTEIVEKNIPKVVKQEDKILQNPEENIEEAEVIEDEDEDEDTEIAKELNDYLKTTVTTEDVDDDDIEEGIETTEFGLDNESVIISEQEERDRKEYESQIVEKYGEEAKKYSGYSQLLRSGFTIDPEIDGMSLGDKGELKSYLPDPEEDPIFNKETLSSFKAIDELFMSRITWIELGKRLKRDPSFISSKLLPIITNIVGYAVIRRINNLRYNSSDKNTIMLRGVKIDAEDVWFTVRRVDKEDDEDKSEIISDKKTKKKKIFEEKSGPSWQVVRFVQAELPKILKVYFENGVIKPPKAPIMRYLVKALRNNLTHYLIRDVSDTILEVLPTCSFCNLFRKKTASELSVHAFNKEPLEKIKRGVYRCTLCKKYSEFLEEKILKMSSSIDDMRDLASQMEASGMIEASNDRKKEVDRLELELGILKNKHWSANIFANPSRQHIVCPNSSDDKNSCPGRDLFPDGKRGIARVPLSCVDWDNPWFNTLSEQERLGINVELKRFGINPPKTEEVNDIFMIERGLKNRDMSIAPEILRNVPFKCPFCYTIFTPKSVSGTMNGWGGLFVRPKFIQWSEPDTTVSIGESGDTPDISKDTDKDFSIPKDFINILITELNRQKTHIDREIFEKEKNLEKVGYLRDTGKLIEIIISKIKDEIILPKRERQFSNDFAKWFFYRLENKKRPVDSDEKNYNYKHTEKMRLEQTQAIYPVFYDIIAKNMDEIVDEMGGVEGNEKLIMEKLRDRFTLSSTITFYGPDPRATSALQRIFPNKVPESQMKPYFWFVGRVNQDGDVILPDRIGNIKYYTENVGIGAILFGNHLGPEKPDKIIGFNPNVFSDKPYLDRKLMIPYFRKVNISKLLDFNEEVFAIIEKIRKNCVIPGTVMGNYFTRNPDIFTQFVLEQNKNEENIKDWIRVMNMVYSSPKLSEKEEAAKKEFIIHINTAVTKYKIPKKAVNIRVGDYVSIYCLFINRQVFHKQYFVRIAKGLGNIGHRITEKLVGDANTELARRRRGEKKNNNWTQGYLNTCMLLGEELPLLVSIPSNTEMKKESSLKQYKKKRKFDETPEPEGKEEGGENKHRFVIQRHDASHLHWDLRLENDNGAMSSWALPKHRLPTGKTKLLAVKTEDHPISYNTFEGSIPEGEYGAGKVSIHDSGRYEEIESKSSKIVFKFNGKKEKGIYNLFKIDGNRWMIIEHKEEKEASGFSKIKKLAYIGNMFWINCDTGNVLEVDTNHYDFLNSNIEKFDLSNDEKKEYEKIGMISRYPSNYWEGKDLEASLFTRWARISCHENAVGITLPSKNYNSCLNLVKNILKEQRIPLNCEIIIEIYGQSGNFHMALSHFYKIEFLEKEASRFDRINKSAISDQELLEESRIDRKRLVEIAEREMKKLRSIGFDPYFISSVTLEISIPGHSDIDIQIGSEDVDATSQKLVELGYPLTKDYVSWKTHTYFTEENAEVDIKVRTKQQLEDHITGKEKMLAGPQEERDNETIRKFRIREQMKDALEKGDMVEYNRIKKEYQDSKLRLYKKYGLIPRY